MKQPESNPLKNLFDKLEPAPGLERRLARAVAEARSPRRRFTVWHGIAATAAVAAIAVAAALFLSTGTAPQALPIAPQASVASEEGEPVSHDFALQAHFASGNADGTEEGMLLEEGVRWEFREQGARLQRGETYVDDQGRTLYKVLRSYAPRFSIRADNVARVSMSCETGKLSAPFTEAQRTARKLANALEGGNAGWSGPITTFTIPNKWPDLTGSDLTGEVYRLWADGELDDRWIPALEAKGFPTQMGFPALLDYYSLFTQPLDDGQVEVQLKLIRIPADKTAFTVDCAKEGAFLSADWHDQTAYKAAAQYPPIPFEELPGDVVTIRVTFTDGQSVTKKVAISFNAQGYAVLELLPA